VSSRAFQEDILIAAIAGRATSPWKLRPARTGRPHCSSCHWKWLRSRSALHRDYGAPTR